MSGRKGGKREESRETGGIERLCKQSQLEMPLKPRWLLMMDGLSTHLELLINEFTLVTEYLPG